MTFGLDPRQPVVVGAGQLTRRRDDPGGPLEPAALMVEALRRAEADSGGRGLLARADAVRVVAELSWRYRNVAALVAEGVGATPRDLAVSVMGGNFAGTLTNLAAADVQAGRADVVLVCGGEATATRTRLRKEGVEPQWTVQDEQVAPPRTIGDATPLVSETETARGLQLPVNVYPIFEIALRARLGLDVEEHRRRLGRLWSAFSEVAATNPHAWIRRAHTPEEITEAGPGNRMVSFPYTKLLCSNNQVDQGAALIVCSVAAAEAAGVPRDRWVFLHAGADTHDHWYVSNRADLCSSPALRVAGRTAHGLAGTSPDQLAHVDLYSCFPAAVQIAARELGLLVEGEGWGGIGSRLPLTVTGGMTFAGGPWNDYTGHGLATMVGVLRDDPGSLGLCTANGGYTTEHSVLLLSTEPPSGPFRHAEPQDEVDALPRVELDDGATGAVTVESYTVAHDRDGPTHALVAARTPAGHRTWCRSDDTDLLGALETDDLVGAAGRRDAAGVLTLG